MTTTKTDAEAFKGYWCACRRETLTIKCSGYYGNACGRAETPLEQEMRLRFTEGAEKRNAAPEAATARASNLQPVGKRPAWLDAISDDLDRKDRAKLQPGGVVRFPPLASQEELDRDDNRGSFMLGLVLILLGAGYGGIIGALVVRWMIL